MFITTIEDVKLVHAGGKKKKKQIVNLYMQAGAYVNKCSCLRGYICRHITISLWRAHPLRV